MPNGENHVGRITYSSVLKVDAVGDTGKQDRERAIFIILDSAPSLVVASARRTRAPRAVHVRRSNDDTNPRSDKKILSEI